MSEADPKIVLFFEVRGRCEILPLALLLDPIPSAFGYPRALPTSGFFSFGSDPRAAVSFRLSNETTSPQSTDVPAAISLPPGSSFPVPGFCVLQFYPAGLSAVD